MKTILTIILFVSSLCVNAQTGKVSIKEKSIKFFNITKVSFASVTRAYSDTFIKGEGNFTNHIEYPGHVWSLNTITGVYVTPRLTAGVGLGLDGYHKPNINTFPVFVDLRYYLSKDVDALSTYINLGPTVNFFGENASFKKGTLLNLGVAYKFKATDAMSFVCDVFYNHKTVSLTKKKLKDSNSRAVLDAFGIGFGVMF